MSAACRFHSSRGVGGRFVEVYDLETGAGIEVGRVTVWEPGERLA